MKSRATYTDPGRLGTLSAASPYFAATSAMYGLAADTVLSWMGNVLARSLCRDWSAGTVSAGSPCITLVGGLYGLAADTVQSY